MTLYTMVGIPGSGKSTVAGKLAAEKNCVIVSSDKIREELFGDENVQKNPQLVFAIIYCRIEDFLKDGKNVIFDATNTTRRNRKEVFRIAPEGTKHVAVFVDTPLDVCKQRNKERSRVVPEEVLERMSRKLTTPEKDEGFDKVIVV